MVGKLIKFVASGWLVGAVAVLGLALSQPSRALAQSASVDALVSAIVQVKTFIDPEGRTVESLGRERAGSGIIIGSDGLILTIGYLMVEAHAAEVTTVDGHTVAASVVGYDHDTGFGLLRTSAPIKMQPLRLGKSADVSEGDKVLIAGAGGIDMMGAALIVSKREFAGYWEYLLDEAIFTSPPHPNWSGAALIDRKGELVGIGSLIVGDATGKGDGVAGNMFVPIDRLAPILGELLANGRVSGPAKPWLGFNTEQVDDELVVVRTTQGGPAEKSGVRKGDKIVGVKGTPPKSLADLYRKIWALGTAGVTVPLDIVRDGERQTIDIKSVNRRQYLKLNSTL
jgi:S1-C subfamily serine protease